MKRIILAIISVVIIFSCEKEELSIKTDSYFVIDSTETNTNIKNIDMYITLCFKDTC